MCRPVGGRVSLSSRFVEGETASSLVVPIVWQRMRDMRPSRTSGFFLFDCSQDEVHEVMTLASDLEKITRYSEHHSYLAHELPLFHGVTVASFFAPSLDQGFGFCKPVFGGTEIRCSFSSSSFHHSIQALNQALKIIRSSVLHPLVEGLSRDDWLLARPPFMIAS